MEYIVHCVALCKGVFNCNISVTFKKVTDAEHQLFVESYG